MPSFVDTPGITPAFIALNRSRAVGAGLDPFAYDRVTAEVPDLHGWPHALAEAARAHLAAALRAEADGLRVTAATEFRTAARWFHIATVLPHPDTGLLAALEGEADAATGRALARAEPDRAERIEGPGFVGWLRRPEGVTTPPVVLIAPGLDSSKEEFHVLADALLARGLAVAAFDGPGQGVCAATSAPEPAYHRVIGAVLDRLADAPGIDVGRATLVGMSLGGYYAAESAAHEPRLRAAVAVSGPHHLTWEELPPFVTDTLTRRCGSAEAARAFAAAVDLRPIAPHIPVPLLVVEGGTDVTPGVTTAAATADAAPHGELLLVPHGDHLLGNAQGDWLPQTADWLTSRLDTTRPA